VLAGGHQTAYNAGRMARPSKLTPDVVNDVCRDVEAGLVVALAAEAAGVSRRVVFDWLAKGRADDAAHDAAEVAGDVEAMAAAASPEREFLHRYAQARAKFARKITGDLMSGEKDHRALAYLERTRLPGDYADRALDGAALAEAGATGGEAPAPGAPTPGAVLAELIRCPNCGTGTAIDEPTPARFCAGCGGALPRPDRAA
jgi:hypothetical protein